MKKPLVSIIMNCYNGEKFLNQAIKSILNQTYRNWELIFWDNKSKDKSKKIFKSFKDKRLKYFLASTHSNLYRARNLALNKCRGSFVTFLDVDDYWSSKKIELEMNQFKKDSKVGVVYSNLWILNQKTKKKKIFINKCLYQGNIFKNIIKEYNIPMITVLIKKSILKRLKIFFDDRFNHIGDFDLIIRLSKKTNFCGLNKPLAVYRAHGNNLTTIDKQGSIKELELWLFENKLRLSHIDKKYIQNRIDKIKIKNYKMLGNYYSALKTLFKNQNNLNLRNIINLILPNFLLKKLYWY